MRYKRVAGGERNAKTGTRWTKDELHEVFTLFLHMGGVGIHERNPQIQRLAMRLGRTVRSTEAQLLMFRNLEKRGDYSRENMSRLCREIWEEYHNSLRQ